MGFIAAPPSPPAILDLLTGNDSQFTSSLGNWTNTGGTLTRDTTGTWRLSGFAASLKFVTTASGQHCDVSIAGSFTAGQRYDVLALLKIEENSFSGDTLDLLLGLQGTDMLDLTYSLSANLMNTGSGWSFATLYGVWTPTANRTGVTLRLNRSAGSSTVTTHLGLVRVARIANAGDIGLGLSQNPVAPNTAAEIIAGQPGLSFIGATDDNGDNPVQLLAGVTQTGRLAMYPGANPAALTITGNGGTSFGESITALPSSGGEILAGTVDPTAGGGVPHSAKALYIRDNSGTTELWTPTGAGNTAWQKVTIP